MRMATELFNAYLDGYELTRDQARTLSEWVKESPENARTIVLLAQIHESLDSRMCVPRMLEDLTRIGDPEVRDEISDSLDAFFHKVEQTSPLYVASPPPQKKPRMWLIGSGWAAAAALLLVIYWSSVGSLDRAVVDNRDNPVPPAERTDDHGEPVEPKRLANVRPAELVATIDQLVAVEWGGERKLRGDQLLQGETLHLEEGIVSLTTTVGHAVVIEGPAQVVVESPQQLTMEYGRVVGRVGVHGGSLEFSTPTATIRDLGTEFGVEVAGDRQTRVAVYDGAIELKGIQEPMAVEVAAGAGRRVTPEGSLLEETLLPHDREFVRLDEVDLRVAGRHGDDEAEALATYYALVRSGTLLAYQNFHAPSRGLERTIGLGSPPVRSAAPLVMGRDLRPESLLASGGLRLESVEYVFLPIDVRPTSPMARSSLLSDEGLVGRDGTEVWIAWLAQSDSDVGDLKQYAGLSLTVSDTDDSRDTFLGRIHNRNFLGVQFNFDADDDRTKHELDLQPRTTGVQGLDADKELHRWVVHLSFTEQEDHIRVWLDVPLDELEKRKPHYAGSRDQIEFDRLRIAVSETSEPWTFDEVMIAASAEDLAAAEKIITQK